MIRLHNYLSEKTDNIKLILFRIGFGVLIIFHCFSEIFIGKVKRTFIDPEFTFSFIGLEWLQPLAGWGMYFYFALMGILGLFIALGYYYRIAGFLFFLMWSASYLMQKTAYNNHYYLMILLAAFIVIAPAHKDYSLDVRFGRVKQEKTSYRIYHLFILVEVFIVYLIASTNKMHWDWVMAKPISIWFSAKKDYFLIGGLLQEDWFQKFIAWGGIAYDGLIGSLLVFPPTRIIGFIASIFFNLFNSFVFKIGIFPYLMILFSVMYFPFETIRRKVFFNKDRIQSIKSNFNIFWTYFFILIFIFQIYLSIRHHFYKGDVHWTEEGHRLAWQMMLRSKSGTVKFRVIDKETGELKVILPRNHMTAKQYRRMAGSPDMIWQFAQRLAKENREEGKEVEIYAVSYCSLNGGPRRALIDPEVNLANVKWDYFKHSDWILTYED